MKKHFMVTAVIFLTACQNQNYSSNQPSHGAVIGAAFQDVGQAGQACRADKRNKTNYKIYTCINGASDRILRPVVLNQAAFNTLQNNMLELSLRIDRKTVTADEVEFYKKKYIDEFVQAEAQQEAQQRVYYQQQQQRQNAAWAAGLQSLGNSMQQNYMPPQQINCGTVYNAVGASTTCQ